MGMIAITGGTLDNFTENCGTGLVDAKVMYALSNGELKENAHMGIPVAVLNAHAMTQGRATYTRDDICAVIAANLGADFDGCAITPATPHAS